MGSVVDTTVFVDLERASRRRQERDPGRFIGERLAACLGSDDEAALAAITASELLHGVHRATAEYRATREAFVESILAAMPVLEFGLLAARVHARLWSDLMGSGVDVGAHDRLVAATAISVGWRVATGDTRHFDRVPGLEVVRVR